MCLSTAHTCLSIWFFWGWRFAYVCRTKSMVFNRPSQENGGVKLQQQQTYNIWVFFCGEGKLWAAVIRFPFKCMKRWRWIFTYERKLGLLLVSFPSTITTTIYPFGKFSQLRALYIIGFEKQQSWLARNSCGTFSLVLNLCARVRLPESGSTSIHTKTHFHLLL